MLVNEYGLVGLDAALMQPTAESGATPGVEIREVAGGCICCSAAFMFEVSLMRLLQRRPDRLLIEPTGLATASGILGTLGRPGFSEGVDVRSVVCLLDPCRLDEATSREEVQDQIEAADVLLAGRSDLATADQLGSFYSWANALRPVKRFVGQIEKGRVAPEFLDLVADRGATLLGSDHPPGTNPEHHEAHEHDTVAQEQAVELICDASQPIVQRSHCSPAASTMGWICWDGLVFDAQQVSRWLRELAQLPGARRIKAVLRTNEGWKGFNFADGIEEVTQRGDRKDSRLEIVIESKRPPNADTLEQTLRACLVTS